MRWLAILLLFLPAAAHAQCSGAFLPGAPSPTLRWDGRTPAGIFASTIWDPDGPGPLTPRLVVGGSMTTIAGQDTSSVAAFDGSQWYPMPLTGIPMALGTWNGDLIAAGNGFARRWNGTSWDTLGTLAGTVRALQEFNGDLYAVGNITGRVLRFHGGAWQPVPGLTAGGTTSMTLAAGQLVVGGFSLQATGNPASVPAMAWNGAAWSPMPGGFTTISSLCVNNGDLIACGAPASGGTNVARWDGSAWQPMGSSVPLESMCQLAVTTQGLLVAAYTDHRSFGTPSYAAGIYRWNGAQWTPFYAPTDPESLTTESFTLIEYNSQLFWGGTIYTATGDIGSPFMGLLCQRGPTFGPIQNGPSYSITGLTTYDNGIVAWGPFFSVGGINARRIAFLDSQGWHSIGGGLGTDGSYSSIAYIYAATQYNGDLYVTGSFSRMGSLPTPTATSFVAWNGSSWRTIANGPTGGNYSVAGMILQGPDLFAFGNFNYVNSTAFSPYLARYNGAAWSPFPIPPASPLLAAAVFNNQLIVAEDTLNAHHGLARWDGAAWQQLGAGLSNGTANVLTIFNSELIAAGNFTGAGGQSAAHIARWDGTTWRTLGPGLNNNVNALSVYNNELYAAGTFTSSGALTNLGGLARWNGSQWSPVDAGVSGVGYSDGSYTSGAPVAMAPLGADLLIAGNFKNAGPNHSPYLARWATHPCCGSADFNCDGDTGTDQDIEAFFACLSGLCPALPCPNSADFNADGDVGTDQDIEAFFRVLSGGTC